MRDQSRNPALIAIALGGAVVAAVLSLRSSGLQIPSLTAGTVALLIGRVLFLILLAAAAHRCWEARQTRVSLGSRRSAASAPPRLRSHSPDKPSAAHRRHQTLAQRESPSAAAARAARLAEARALLADLRDGAGGQTTTPPQQDVGAVSHVGGDDSAAASDGLAACAVSGGAGESEAGAQPSAAPAAVEPAAAELSAAAAAVPLGSTATPGSQASGGAHSSEAVRAGTEEPAVAGAAGEAAAEHADMAPKTLQQARAEMLARAEAAKAQHEAQQRLEREELRRQRMAEADARLEEWRAAQRAAEAAEEMSWAQLTAERRAAEARQWLLREQDAEYQEALRRDSEVAAQERRQRREHQTAAEARRATAERVWLECAAAASAAAAQLAGSLEPPAGNPDAAVLSLRLPSQPPQRRRFSGSNGVGQVYAWAQLALLQGICPTMDAHVAALQQQGPADGAVAGGPPAEQTPQPQDDSGRRGSSIAGAAAPADGEVAVAGETAAEIAAVAAAAARADGDAAVAAALPAERDDDWVQRWADSEGDSSSSWAWHGGWRLVQTYPRREVPRGDGRGTDGGNDGGSTIAEAGLAPQAALAVEQLG